MIVYFLPANLMQVTQGLDRTSFPQLSGLTANLAGMVRTPVWRLPAHWEHKKQSIEVRPPAQRVRGQEKLGCR
jgi:hypothetical protein